MADDMGWSDIGCYGSEIETLTLTAWQKTDSGSPSFTIPDDAALPGQAYLPGPILIRRV